MNGATWYLDLPNYLTSKELEFLNRVILKIKCGIVANNISHLRIVTKKIGGSFLNVYNTKTIQTFKDFGLQKFFIAELPENEINTLKVDFDYNFKEKVYMTLKFCPMKEVTGADCGHCPFNQGWTYRLNNKEFKLTRKKCVECTFYLTD